MPSRSTDPGRPSFEARRRAQQASARQLASHLLLLSNRFSYVGRHTLFGRASLFGDRIELRHWTWRGRCTRRILLTQILAMDYHPLDGSGNLTLVLETDEVLQLTLDEAHRWREHFEQWLSYAVLPSAKLMGGDRDKAATLSG